MTPIGTGGGLRKKENKCGPRMKIVFSLVLLSLSLGVFCDGQHWQESCARVFEAIREGNVQKVLSFLSQGISINCRGPYLYTPLLTAAKFNQLEIARLLCEKGADVNAASEIDEFKGEGGYTPLVWASRNCNVDMAELLISKGATVNLAGPGEDTPLMAAASKGCLPLVQRLLEKGASIDQKRSDDRGTALYDSIVWGHLDVAEYLIENNADIKMTDQTGKSLLLIAVGGRYLAEVRYLVEKGLDVNAQSTPGLSSIFLAIGDSAESLYVLEYLISHGGNILLKDNRGVSPLMQAAWQGYVKATKLLIDNGAAINDRDEENETPLHYACRGLYALNELGTRLLTKVLSTITLLVVKGADVNAKDQKGRTPLMIASKYPASEVVRILLERDAQVNAQDKEGWTALMYAASENQVGVLTLLFENGADLNLRSETGKTALQIAKDKKKTQEAYSLLIRLGAKYTDGRIP